MHMRQYFQISGYLIIETFGLPYYRNLIIETFGIPYYRNLMIPARGPQTIFLILVLGIGVVFVDVIILNVTLKNFRHM